MRRGHYTPEGMIEYHKHNIGLMDDGRLVCRELGIVADTLEEVKKAIRERETKRSKLAKIDVWFRGRYGDREYRKGSTTALGVGYRNADVWVTWKGEHGDNERTMVGAEGVYPVTPENDKIIEAINTMRTQISMIEQEIDKLEEQLVAVEPIEEP